MTVKNESAAPKVGASITFRKTMTVAEQAMFTGITGNLGGLYVDRIKARSAGLGDMAAFELAAAGLLTTCLSRLAGSGYRIASFAVEFERAIEVGETVEAKAILASAEGGRLVFTLLMQVDGASLCAGRAVLVTVGQG